MKRPSNSILSMGGRHLAVDLASGPSSTVVSVGIEVYDRERSVILRLTPDFLLGRSLITFKHASIRADRLRWLTVTVVQRRPQARGL